MAAKWIVSAFSGGTQRRIFASVCPRVSCVVDNYEADMICLQFGPGVYLRIVEMEGHRSKLVGTVTTITCGARGSEVPPKVSNDRPE